MNSQIKIETLPLFSILDDMLIELLSSLTIAEWNTQTVAKHWKVKDVVAHLLDGNLRGLSTSRDGYFGAKPDNIHSYQDLVSHLNQLNRSWTSAADRLSPQVLTSLLAITGAEYLSHLRTLDPMQEAIFPVAWAGQTSTPNWFHIAREYTEKFLHQQQIRDALGKNGMMTKELFCPFIETLMYAFPYTFRNVEAETGTVVSLVITTEIGGQWNIIKTDSDWLLTEDESHQITSKTILEPETAWKLFSKSWLPEQVMQKVIIEGDKALGEQILRIVAVMA